MNRQERLDLAAAYALDAVDDAERAEIEAALAEDDELAGQVRADQETAAQLAEAVAATPPVDLRDRVLGAVAAMPQEHAPAPVALPEQRGPAHAAPDDDGTVVSLASRRRDPVVRWLAAAAAVAALVAGVAGVSAVRNAQTADQLVAEQARIAEVLAAPDAQTSSGDVSGGGRGTVVVSPSLQEAVFVADDLPALDDQTYQLWLIGPEGAESAGLVSGEGGDVTRILEGTGGTVTTIGLSREPEGGSPQPTDPILLVPVA